MKEFKINQDRKLEVQLFLQGVKNNGLYPDMVVNKLESHIMEGSTESIVESIFHEEPIWICTLMMQILIEFGYHKFNKIIQPKI